MSCLFCEIAAGNIPSTKVYEDELVYAFRDIAPQAPVHVLIIPKKHIESAQALTAGDDALLCHMFACARRIAESEGVAKSGYRHRRQDLEVGQLRRAHGHHPGSENQAGDP